MSALVDFEKLQAFLKRHCLTQYEADLISACKASNANRHGGLEGWLAVLNNLPDLKAEKINLFNGVKFQSAQCGTHQRKLLEQQLLELAPWRKGPFDLFGIHIDSEWRSDLKWQRLADRIDLQDKCILDVGCGNGYYMFRMLGGGAKCVLGVDPVPLYVIQFKAINKFIRTNQLQLLPVGLESLPQMPVFDVIFSMGVLYHRRSPEDHLLDLKKHLNSSGELVLETLVISGSDEDVLVPAERYAGMKNVWSIPTVPTLVLWLQQAGYKNIQLIDSSKTTLEEQRRTPWMQSHSLNQFLNPDDQKYTIEGYPAPLRALIKCSV